MNTRLRWFVSLGFLISVVTVFAAATVINQIVNEKTLQTAAPAAASNGAFSGADDATVSKIIAERTEIQSLLDQIREAKSAGHVPSHDLYRRLHELLPPSRERNGGNLDQGGEDCASAAVISTVPYTDFGTTTGYQDNLPECEGSGTSPDVVYTYTPTTSGNYHVSLCGSSYDTKLFVYANTCTGSPIACNDDGAACGDVSSDIPMVELTGGTTYFIIVDGWSDGSFGDYAFYLEETAPPPTGDACGDPIVIPSLPFSVDNASNCGFNNNYSGSTCLSSQDAGPDVIYSFTLTTETSVEIILNAHLADPPNEVWVMPGILLSDHCPPDWSCIASASSWTVDGFTPLYLSCNALQPGTYYIMVDNGNWFHPCYTYDLVVQTCGPCNLVSQPGDIEEVAEPFPVPGTFSVNDPDGGCNNATPYLPQFQNILSGQTVHGQTFAYTDSITGSLMADRDWYRFVLTASATLTCTYSGESWLRAALVQGPCPGTVILNGIQSTPCGLRTITSTCLDPGEYYVKISRGGALVDDAMTYDYRTSFVLTPCVQSPGRCCYDGLCANLTHYECAVLDGYWDGNLTCVEPCPIYPPNDHCRNAGVPATLPATFTGTTTNATNDCPQAYDPQVWHVFINPEMQDIQIDYCGTVGFGSYNQYLYDGCSCTGQTEADGYDIGMCSPTALTLLWRNLPAGTWYYPVSWYVPQSDGPYTLHVNAVSSEPPVNDECTTATPITVVPNGAVTVTGTTMNATVSCTNTCFENGFDYNSTGGDVFYSLNLTECRRIAMSVGFGWMHISVYQGLENCCTDPAILCNGQDSYFQPLPDWDVPEQHLGGMNSYVADTLGPGVYLIRVAHYATMVGAYTLTVYDNGSCHCLPPDAPTDVTAYRVGNVVNLRWTTDAASAARGTYRLYANISDMPIGDPSWIIVADSIAPVVGPNHLYYSAPFAGNERVFYYVTGVCQDGP